jgi:outer membrane protein OmpA-like peptidoglycan-associated protein
MRSQRYVQNENTKARNGGMNPKKRKRRMQLVTRSAMLLSLLMFAGSAGAQSTRLNQYRVAPVASDGFVVSRPTDQGHMKWGGQIHLDYGYEPLVLEGDPGDPGSIVGAVVEHQLVGHLGASLGLFDRVVVFGGYYANLVEEGETVPAAAPADGTSPGDALLGARVRILGDEQSVFSLAGELTGAIPVAHLIDDSLRYAGEEVGSIEPEVIAAVRVGGVEIDGNLGARFRKEAPATGVTIGHELTYALGAHTYVADRLRVHGELWGASTIADIGDREASPMEILAGAKYLPCEGWARGFVFGGSVSTGLLSGFGTPLVRVVGMAGFADPEGCPEPAPPPEPLDSDGDGLNDPLDECPLEPEDVDDFEDQDGCPDPDNDGDGVLDADDACPLNPEDRDGFEDDDGCPDPDNDQDQVPDARDACPMDPEDRDGFEDDNGCADPDNDNDTVLDAEDACPLEPGSPEEKGCPKTIRVEEGQIVILQRVEFATGKDVILERSMPVLEEVRLTLDANDRIERVRIEGHTDARGRDASNMDLSRRRARSVVRWLIDQGIDTRRLEAWGCGEIVPIESNDTQEGRQANRRVEFHILEPAPEKGARSVEGCEQIEVK